MQKVMNLFAKRTLSTARIDDMPSGEARAALGKRLQNMLALQAAQPMPQPRRYAPLSNPIQNVANS